MVLRLVTCAEEYGEGCVWVDEADLPVLSQSNWHRNGRYARTERVVGSSRQRIYMHQFLLATPKGFYTDHINGDGLDNRRSNLRVVTPAQNGENRHKACSNSGTGVRGVHFEKRSGRYMAIVSRNGRQIYRSYHMTLELATQAVESARARVFTHSSESGNAAIAMRATVRGEWETTCKYCGRAFLQPEGLHHRSWQYCQEHRAGVYKSRVFARSKKGVLAK